MKEERLITVHCNTQQQRQASLQLSAAESESRDPSKSMLQSHMLKKMNSELALCRHTSTDPNRIWSDSRCSFLQMLHICPQLCPPELPSTQQLFTGEEPLCHSALSGPHKWTSARPSKKHNHYFLFLSILEGIFCLYFDGQPKIWWEGRKRERGVRIEPGATSMTIASVLGPKKKKKLQLFYKIQICVIIWVAWQNWLINVFCTFVLTFGVILLHKIRALLSVTLHTIRFY